MSSLTYHHSTISASDPLSTKCVTDTLKQVKKKINKYVISDR